MRITTTITDRCADRCTDLGLGLLVAAILGCGPDATADPASDAPNERVSAAVQGRAFTDTSPVSDAAIPSTAEESAQAIAAADLPIGIAGLAGSVDPARLTPEALAENPLVIGTKPRKPFELAEGADPLDPNSYDWVKDDDGHWIIGYSDLSLADTDKELLLDALVYPDEYEGEEIEFPDRIRALDGEKVALTGYMIPLLWNENRVPHFMLVRDLLQCCFGGSPEPDEWIDVQMVGKGTTYWAYVPVVVRGTFRVAGQADEAGYATGAFAIDATDAREE